MASPDLFSEINFDDKPQDSLDLNKVTKNPQDDIVKEILNNEKVNQEQYNELIDNYRKLELQYKAKDQELNKLVHIFINFNDECDLNWIDVSNVTNMSYLFMHSNFNGDISKWNVSNVTNMSYMFAFSQFNGDISKWDVSNVESVRCMFMFSRHRGDISNWSNNANCDQSFFIVK